MSEQKTRAVLYIRVSTDEQAESGYSIADQKRDLMAHARKAGYTVVEPPIVDDGYSGAVGMRPGLTRILELAEAGEIDLVLAKKRNRLFRNRYWRLSYEKDLEEHGVSLVALDDTGNRFADAMNDEFADWYREEVTKNTIAGRIEKAKQGKLIAAYKPIYGFAFTPDREGYVMVEHKMAVVRRVIETIASGGSIRGTKRMLECERIPAPGGGMIWREKTIRDMVNNDAYRPHPYEELVPQLTTEARSKLNPHEEYGVVWYPQKKVTRLDPDPTRGYKRPRIESRPERGEQVPIPVASSGIPPEVIDAARRAIKDNVRIRNTGDRVYQLLGLIRCSECRYLMTKNQKAGKNKTYHYYRCSNHQRYGRGGCTMNKGFPADELERRVLHAVLDAVKDKDELIRKANETFEQEKASILRSGRIDATEYHRQLDAIERQRVNYQRAFAADALSLGDLKSRTAELDAEKDHIQRVIVEYENRVDKLKTLENIRDRSIRQIQRGEWGKLGMTTPKARRERYQEIGLRAKAAADGTLQLLWGIGEEAVVGTANPTS